MWLTLDVFLLVIQGEPSLVRTRDQRQLQVAARGLLTSRVSPIFSKKKWTVLWHFFSRQHCAETQIHVVELILFFRIHSQEVENQCFFYGLKKKMFTNFFDFVKKRKRKKFITFRKIVKISFTSEGGCIFNEFSQLGRHCSSKFL